MDIFCATWIYYGSRCYTHGCTRFIPELTIFSNQGDDQVLDLVMKIR